MGVIKLKENISKAVLDINGTRCELPMIVGSEGEIGIDIGELRNATTAVTLDPAFMNTASCASQITFLDGEKGILQYRGYSIEELAEKSTFTEVAYLLVCGELPTRSQLEAFENDIKKHSKTPTGLKNLIKQYPKEAHPMAVLSALTVSLSAYFEETSSRTDKLAETAQLMAQLKNLSAYCYRHAQNLEFVDSDPKLDYSSDFLNMMFHKPGYKIEKDVVDALNILLILHADHEQNCSTSAVRLIGSSKANVFASVAGGINALWGPLHGGANQAVIEMLELIQKDGSGYKAFVEKAKDKNSNFKLMGFGHRVYKNFDPRAKIIKKACDSVLKKLGIQDPLLDIAKGLEEAALQDAYFKDRKLYPNVDFYSGIIYKALNIPTNMFTVMFALGRLPGWLAQWKEMNESAGSKIGRPRQIYTGYIKRSYVPMNKRG